jgi:hypothetical protein
MNDSPHVMGWKLRISLAFQTKCSCGWVGAIHVMERDATAEWREHNAQVHENQPRR